MTHREELRSTGVEIAVVGMAARFPGAKNLDAFWRNLCNGVESITRFSDEALRELGVPAALLADPTYVKAGIVLEGMDQFDAGFFGYSARDAEFLDPQHRLLLEIAWHALEHAGYSRATWPALTGIYAGSGASLYLMRHLLPMVDWRTSDISFLQGLLNANDKDSLAMRVAYKLDLRGPAVSVQTACSTSLAAVHFACRGLLNHEADMALAGGVSLNLFQDGGYRYQAGAILSPDGHCRAFDAQAAGTVMGSGAGIVVLKRLADALADRDTIHAIIKGSALNNDGATKVGYTAPSVDGQTEVILAAQAMAEVSADSIGYVEAHGTGTTLGDPIEIAALTQAFRASTQRRGFCAIGSVKTNIGHLDAAAGVAGLIKGILALEHKTLPLSPNFVRANSQIDFSASPFVVNTATRPWSPGHSHRRAGVSSFGMGGTNVHVILEEAPQANDLSPGVDDAPTEEMQILMLSARSAASLERAVEQLADHLERHQDQSLPDIAHTLRVGRKRFEHRCAVLARRRDDAIRALRERSQRAFFRGQSSSDPSSIAFIFPGQGSQRVGMGREIYERESQFRDAVHHCCELLWPRLGLDLREIIYPLPRNEDTAAARLDQTEITQPALFVIEYAMAKLWMSWGLQPSAMLGHSIGEYVAACLAGVFSLRDALEIVAARGRLMQSTPPGAMLAVSLTEAQVEAYLAAGCDLAAVNAAESCVLSGPTAVVDRVELDLSRRGVPMKRLRVSHAFHSALVEPMLGEFVAQLSQIELRPPRIPFVSNVSGTWITSQEACNPTYWAQHVRQTVRFMDGIDKLLDESKRILIEVGPGETLLNLARRRSQEDGQRLMLSSQCGADSHELNRDQPARCMAALWVNGIEISPDSFGAGERRRVPLPGYPFERKSYWIQPPAGTTAASASKRTDEGASSSTEIADWLYVPNWTRFASKPRAVTATNRGPLLLLGKPHDLDDRLFEHLRRMQREVVRVEPGLHFAQLGEWHYAVRPGESGDMERVLRGVESRMQPISDVCHLWSLDSQGAVTDLDEALGLGFRSLIALVRALDTVQEESSKRKVSLLVVTNGLEDVTGTELLFPAKATLHGPCKVIPQEYPNITCRLVDAETPADGAQTQDRLVRQIVTELESQSDETVVAYRGPHRWIKAFEPAKHEQPVAQRLRKQGVYVITGGLGGIGLTLSRHLAKEWRAKLVLLTRKALPPREQWPDLSVATNHSATIQSMVTSLLELESLGAEVLVPQADVADPVQLREAIDQSVQRFGAIHGVVHAAGEAGGGLIVSQSRIQEAKVFAPKVHGTLNLFAALEHHSPDFVVLCSSLAAITGGFGQADYCAANCFLDAMAVAASRRDDRLVLSINWDTWREIGMARGQKLPSGVGITPSKGAALFEALLSSPRRAQILVSTIDLEQQFAQMCSADIADRLLSQHSPTRQGHPRPALETPYVEPVTELERSLAVLWTEFVGVSPIGVNDNLFELGSDSLTAIQLLTKVRGAYEVEIHPAAFFKAPTIAELAVLIETRLIEEIEDAESLEAPVSPVSATA